MSKRYARDMRGTATITLECTGVSIDGTVVNEDCGMLFPIRRRKRSLREPDHIKDLFCVKCGCTTKHIERRESYFMGLSS